MTQQKNQSGFTDLCVKKLCQFRQIFSQTLEIPAIFSANQAPRGSLKIKQLDKSLTAFSL